jgi:hypothetical protein
MQQRSSVFNLKSYNILFKSYIIHILNTNTSGLILVKHDFCKLERSRITNCIRLQQIGKLRISNPKSEGLSRRNDRTKRAKQESDRANQY